MDGHEGRQGNVDYVDTAQQRVTDPWAFTFADFALCDARHSARFACVVRAAWSEAMLPAADWLALDESEAARRIPYLLAVDGEDALHRVIDAWPVRGTCKQNATRRAWSPTLSFTSAGWMSSFGLSIDRLLIADSSR